MIRMWQQKRKRRKWEFRRLLMMPIKITVQRHSTQTNKTNTRPKTTF